MSAQPVEHGDPLDPVRILEDLPEDEREAFAAAYREHWEAARDPEGWAALHRWLRRMRGHAMMAAMPGYQERAEAARTGTGEWIPLEEAVRIYRPAS